MIFEQDLFTQILMISAILTFITAAICDFKRRSIPDSCSLILIAIWLAKEAYDFNMFYFFTDIACAFTVFIAVFLLFITKILGGGDAKLLVASSLFAGYQNIFSLLFLTAILGAILACLYALKILVSPYKSLRYKKFLLRNTELPYAIPIALSAIFILVS